MNNLKDMVLSEMESNGETEDDIETIHLGEAGWGGHGYSGPLPTFADRDDAYVASLDELDYDGNGGFGSESFHSFYVYTCDYIYIKRVYDGAESVASIPRNPNPEVKPEGVGGG